MGVGCGGALALASRILSPMWTLKWVLGIAFVFGLNAGVEIVP
jgi:hypothetical protein